jgi:hypothetical protein
LFVHDGNHTKSALGSLIGTASPSSEALSLQYPYMHNGSLVSSSACQAPFKEGTSPVITSSCLSSMNSARRPSLGRAVPSLRSNPWAAQGPPDLGNPGVCEVGWNRGTAGACPARRRTVKVLHYRVRDHSERAHKKPRQ